MVEINQTIPLEIWPAYQEKAHWDTLPHYHAQQIEAALVIHNKTTRQDDLLPYSQDPFDM